MVSQLAWDRHRTRTEVERCTLPWLAWSGSRPAEQFGIGQVWQRMGPWIAGRPRADDWLEQELSSGMRVAWVQKKKTVNLLTSTGVIHHFISFLHSASYNQRSDRVCWVWGSCSTHSLPCVRVHRVAAGLGVRG